MGRLPNAAGHVERALAAYRTMQRRFRLDDGAGLYRERRARLRLRRYSSLWPFSQALAATLDVARLGDEVAVDEVAATARPLDAYWDGRASAPAYDSKPRPPLGRGGSKYYDDNAWVGLALVDCHRLFGVEGALVRAGQLFDFARTGWDTDPSHPRPGGVFWMEQGPGTRNHDRNTVSSAPNAELGLWLALAPRADGARGAPELDSETSGDALRMYEWVRGALDSAGDGLGPFYDKVYLDGTIDTTVWTYNQGSMVGAATLRYRLSGDQAHLREAEEMARRALAHFAGGGYAGQPPAFNAIFFSNLMLLRDASGDARLADSIDEALDADAERAWARLRESGPSLLDQAAIVRTLALRARSTATSPAPA